MEGGGVSKHVWTVTLGGQYDRWPVAMFSTKAKAQAWVRAKNASPTASKWLRYRVGGKLPFNPPEPAP